MFDYLRARKRAHYANYRRCIIFCMKIKKSISMHIHTPSPDAQLLQSPSNQKLLIDFFGLLMEWDQQENVAKDKDAESYQRNSNNSHKA